MHQHHSKRKLFQVDRIIMFTDAVFAIAMTLLVMSLNVPSIQSSETDADFLQALSQEIPKLFGFVLSFFLIGLYWFLHHKTFGYVVNYTNKLIWLNLSFLFFIVLMPFTTAIYSTYSVNEFVFLQAPYGLYVANISCIGLLDFSLRRYVFNKNNAVAEELPPKEIILAGERRALAIPIVFLISWLVSFINPILGRCLLFLFPLVMRILGPKAKKSSKK